MEDSPAASTLPGRVLSRILLVAWLAGLLATLACEGGRLRERLIRDATPGQWWELPDLDGTYVLPLLALGPFCWAFPCRAAGDRERSRPRSAPKDALNLAKAGRLRWAACAAVALLSLAMSWHVAHRPAPGLSRGTRVADLFPTMHDEFSYQLQARTFLAGRWFWPGPPAAPEIFHQTHVLNEGRFASRYFPGTGLWLAPWEAVGHAVWGQWLAGMLIAAGFCWLGCELDGLLSGLLAGGLVAASPGMALLGNMLVAHHATLLGLTLFLAAYFRWMRTGSPAWALLSGTGLAWSMLCRPLTAASVGLPFGMWFLWKEFSEARGSLRLREAGLRVNIGRSVWEPASAAALRSLVAMGLPLLLGLSLIGWQNLELTGNPWLTPYSQYTALYTPRHVFGFFNGRANPAPMPAKVLRDYDRWAENLTPELAAKNVRRRLWHSFGWSLGAAPLLMTAVASCLLLPWLGIRQRLLLAAIGTLHLAHVPYWLDGLLHHHYVFESGPLWLLLGAVLAAKLIRGAANDGRWLFPGWLGAMGLLCVTLNYMAVGGTPARIDQGVMLITKPGGAARDFRQQLEQAALDRPALVFVRPAAGEVHGEFVLNDPRFQDDLLIARHRPDLYPLRQLQELFPDRHLYLYDTTARQFTELTSAAALLAQQEVWP